jgi:hypothetical protein
VNEYQYDQTAYRSQYSNSLIPFNILRNGENLHLLILRLRTIKFYTKHEDEFMDTCQ